MHVAMLLSTPLPPEEGIGNFVRNLAHQVRAAGHDVTFLTRGRGDAELDGSPVHRFPAPPIYPFHVQWQGRAVQRWLDAADVDLVHAHMPLVPAIRARAPIVTTFHTPLRTQYRDLEVHRARDRLMKWSAAYNTRLEEALIARSDIVTAVSGGMAEALRRDYGAQDIRVTPNGVDTTRFTPGGERVVGQWLYVGRLARRKGLPDLLEALAVLAGQGKDFEMLLPGQGEYRPLLERMVERLGLADKVRFLGFVPDDELLHLYRTCQALVFPTHYEGMPTTVLEAMSCGMPIVTTDAPGVAGLIEDGVGGCEVPVGDTQALARALRGLLEGDAWRAWGPANRQRAVERHDWKAAGRIMLEACHDAVHANDKP